MRSSLLLILALVIACRKAEAPASAPPPPAPAPSAFPAGRLAQLEQFIRLGYGGEHEEFRSLNFLTERLTTSEAIGAVSIVKSYNAFEGEKVAAALPRFRGRVMGWQFGRDGSPVLWISLPYWTHQREGAPTERGDRIEEAEHKALVEELRKTFVDELGASEFGADEIGKREFRVWWD